MFITAILAAFAAVVLMPVLAGADTVTEIRTFTGHTAQVTSVAFSPDGTQALTGSEDGSAKLWDVSTGAEIRTFTGHTDFVRAVAFSPDGSMVLTGSLDMTAKLWDTATGAELRTFTGHGGWVTSVAFSPDGGSIVTGGFDSTARLWDVSTGTEIRSFTGILVSVNSVAFSPDGTQVLGGGGLLGAVKLWDTATGAEIRSFTGHFLSVASVAFSPDGSQILTSSNDETVKLWDASTGTLIRDFPLSFTTLSVTFSPDSASFLTGVPNTIGETVDFVAQQWDTATGEEIRVFEGHTMGVRSVAFSPNGAFVLTGSSDGTAKLWEGVSAGSDGPAELRGVIYDAASIEGLSCATIVAEVNEQTFIATTDLNGVYDFGEVPTGSYSITAFAPGYANMSDIFVVNADDMVTLDFPMAAVADGDEVIITGNVTDFDTGLPLGGVRVSVDAADDVTYTCAAGDYELRFDLARKQTIVTVTFEAEGYETAMLMVEVGAGERVEVDAQLKVDAPGNIAGVVLASGMGLEDVQITATPRSGAAITGVTSSSGEYVLTNVPLGDYVVRASLAGYLSQQQEVDVTSGASVEANFTLFRFSPATQTQTDLNDDFDDIDMNNDNRLSFEEVRTAMPDLTPAQFTALDTNGNNTLEPNELGGGGGGGCGALSNKGNPGQSGWLLIPALIVLMALAGGAQRRNPRTRSSDGLLSPPGE